MLARVDCTLVWGLALTLGGLSFAARCEVCVGAATALLLLLAARRISAGVALGAVLAGAFGAGRAASVVDAHERRAAIADGVLPSPVRCSARATVASSPTFARGTLRYDAALEGLLCDGEGVSWSGLATLYGGPADLSRGDRIEVVANLAPLQRLWNESGGDPRPGEARRRVVRSGGAIDVRRVARGRGIASSVDRLRAHLRGRIVATFSPSLAPMARALVLGENDLDADDDQAFRTSGLSHLLAVSGMHLVLVLGLVTKALDATLVRLPFAACLDVGRIAAAVGLPIAWWYADVAGFGGSTVRAAWMTTAVLAARCCGRRTSPGRAFGLSLVAMAVVDPLVAFDLSFLLSAAATAGLLAWAAPLGERLARWIPFRGRHVAQAVATTLAASLPCTPILARFAPSFPLGGVPANLVAVPFGECAALPLCLLASFFWWWPAAERGTVLVASGALVIVRGVARTFSVQALTLDLPRPTSWQLCALGVALVAPWAPPRSRWAFASTACSAVVALEILARRAGAPRGILRVTFLDVGQGDAAIVDLPDGTALMLDGGGLVGSPIDVGSRVVAPELRRLRRGKLAAAILTHPHPDHFAGFVTGLATVEIAELWDTGQGEVEGTGGGYRALLDAAKQRTISVLRPDALCGTRTIGGARFDVLAPCPTYSPDRGPNDNSFVIRVSYGTRAVLFVGDAEHEEEHVLLATAAERLHADVLKVGHHGSRTSSTEAFIRAVAPSEAVVSVGRRNHFGHPSPQTLETLRDAGCRVWRTDRNGAVTMTTDGSSLEIRAVAAW
jgi:competence protein ComEC